jgi:hypothetical protein
MIEIKKYFQKMVPISEKDWEFFSSKLIKREFAKKSIILKVGHKENYLSFIEKGRHIAYCETIIREVVPSIIPKWKPAQNNGETCSQKLKIKTYIHFE